MVTDAGGKRPAALRVLVGRDDIVRLLEGLTWRHGGPFVDRFEAARINGAPGLIVHLQDGPETLALEPAPDGRIQAIYVVRNPDKLAHLTG
jgi:RNA polymerase sigma-70 factor (ECF subfamily)